MYTLGTLNHFLVNDGQALPNLHPVAGLLPAFADSRLIGGFVGSNLASRKFPKSSPYRSLGPPSYEDFITPADDRYCDLCHPTILQAIDSLLHWRPSP
jgi:hypothetical protein